MDDAAFDALARSAGRLGSRRRVLALLGGGVAAIVGARRGEVGAAERACRKWTLAGGPEGTEPIGVDDQIFLYVNGDRVYGLRDQEAGLRPPISFRARSGNKLRVVARDTNEPCFQLNPIYLGCARGGGNFRRLDRGVAQTCDRQRPAGVFFNKQFTI